MPGLNVRLDTTGNGPIVVDASNRLAASTISAGGNAVGSWDVNSTINTSFGLNTQGFGSLEFSLRGGGGGTFTSGQLIFEVSDDLGVTFFPIPVLNLNTFARSSVFVASGVNSGNVIFVVSVGGFTNFRVRLQNPLAGTGTPSMFWVGQLFSFPIQPAAILSSRIDGAKLTYRASVAHYVPAATPTDVGVLTGSSTTIVRINKIMVQGFATTAGTMELSILRRTTVDTAGTSTTVVAPALDSNDLLTATATVRKYTANPTLGTGGNPLDDTKLAFPIAGSVNPPLVLTYGDGAGAKALIVRGTTEQIAINLNAGAVPTGGTISYTFEWTEE